MVSKRVALKLKPGDRIIYGERKTLAKHLEEGRVIHVTPKGGVKIEMVTRSGRMTGVTMWVPYHFIYEIDEHRMWGLW
jgi:hypothetical protein